MQFSLPNQKLRMLWKTHTEIMMERLKKNRTATPVPRNVCQEAASEVREHCKTTY